VREMPLQKRYPREISGTVIDRDRVSCDQMAEEVYIATAGHRPLMTALTHPALPAAATLFLSVDVAKLISPFDFPISCMLDL